MDAFIPFKLFFLLFLGALSRSGRGEAAPTDLGSDASGLMANVGATGVAVTEGTTTGLPGDMGAETVGNGDSGAGNTPITDIPGTDSPSSDVDAPVDMPQTPAPDTGISDVIGMLDDLLGDEGGNQTATPDDTLGGEMENVLGDEDGDQSGMQGDTLGDVVDNVIDVVTDGDAPYSDHAPREGEEAAYEPVGTLLDTGIDAVSSLLDKVVQTTDSIVSDLGQSLDMLAGSKLLPDTEAVDHAEEPIGGAEEGAQEGPYASFDLLDTVVDAGHAVLSGLSGVAEADDGSLLGLVKQVSGSEGDTHETVSSVVEGGFELGLADTEVAIDLDAGIDLGVSSGADLTAGLGVDLDPVAVDLDLDLAAGSVAIDEGETAIGGDLELDLGVSHLLDLNASASLDLDFNLEIDEATYLLADEGNPQDGAYDHEEPLLDLSLDLNLGLDLFPEAAHEVDAGRDLHGGLFPEVTLGLAEMDGDQADENDAPETALPIISDLAQMFGLNDLPLLSPDEYAVCEEEEEEADHDLLFFL